MEFLESANWAKIYDQQLVAASSGSSYSPLPPVTITGIDQDFIAVLPSFPQAPATWWLGAWLTQVAEVPGVGPVTLTRRRIPLNQNSLVNLANITPYSLKIQFPFWIETLKLEIWKYSGDRPIET